MTRVSAAALAAADKGPDYSAVVSIIEGRIADAKTKQSKASGEASQAWASIEKMGVNKGGAQMAAKIMNIEDADERDAILRSFSKVLEAAGISITVDIVDMAEGKQPEIVPTKKVKAEAPAEAPKGPDDQSDLAGVAEGKPEKSAVDKVIESAAGDGEPPVESKATRKRNPIGLKEGLERSRNHLSVVGSGKPEGDATGAMA